MVLVLQSEQDKRALESLEVDPQTLTDDGFDYLGHLVRKPWGYEHLLGANESLAVWKLHINPGAETSFHCHTKKTTALIVLEGEVSCSTFAGEFPIAQGQMAIFGDGVFHKTTAALGAVVLEFETPNNKSDVVRLSDKYGREDWGYEKWARVPLDAAS